MVLGNPIESRTKGVYDTRHFFANAAGCQLFLNERDSDVAIKVEWDGNCWHLPAHRLVLTSMSEVFRTMFDTDMSEKNYGEIKIRDSSPLTVKQFLKYLYMGTLDFNGWIEAVDLMKIAHKYSVNTLVILCESFLITAMTFSNVCFLYETAQTYNLVNLEKQASILILGAAFIIATTDGFLNMKPKSLEFFLRSSLLNMENECCVLTTLREWATVNCSRRGVTLTRENVLNDMKPFMKFINWDLIPEQLRTFVPNEMVKKQEENIIRRRRKPFHVANPVQNHIYLMKFIVELGNFYEDKTSDTHGLSLLKFGIDNHAFIAGFRMIGMFKEDILPNTERSSLMFGRDDQKSYSIFNLNSLPWTKGATVGHYIWQELTAFLPYPMRINPFSTYMVTLKYDSTRSLTTKWPYTRLDSGTINSSVGTINFHCCSECYGITQLFILPAPPPRNVCNDDS